VECEVRQVNLRQDQDDGEQRQFEYEKCPFRARHDNTGCEKRRLCHPGSTVNTGRIAEHYCDLLCFGRILTAAETFCPASIPPIVTKPCEVTINPR